LAHIVSRFHFRIFYLIINSCWSQNAPFQSPFVVKRGRIHTLAVCRPIN
jgi:hypothetical protein